ncbi:MAG: hypothetical protein APR63_04930 [Desulfuromonas sp. SDB]|nr:MAG: hypothetical protein APR63_04930 [Desulfuromonas sp. SDB]
MKKFQLILIIGCGLIFLWLLMTLMLRTLVMHLDTVSFEMEKDIEKKKQQIAALELQLSDQLLSVRKIDSLGVELGFDRWAPENNNSFVVIEIKRDL